MTSIDFALELTRFSDGSAKADELKAFRRDVMDAIAVMKVRHTELLAELRKQNGALAARRAHLAEEAESAEYGVDSTLVELLDPEAFARWTSRAFETAAAMDAPERLLQELEEIRAVVRQFSLDTPRFSTLLSLPLEDPTYRDELEKAVSLELQLRQLLESRRGHR